MRVMIDGRPFIPLDEAARRSGYDFEYLKRLAQQGHIEVRRLRTPWLVAEDFAAEYRSVKPQRKPQRKPRAEAGRRRRETGKG